MTRVSIRLGGGGGERARWPLQSTVAPEVRTAGSQRRTSAARKAPNAAGVVPRDPTPTSAMPRRTSALSRSATFGGVRAGGRQQRLPRRHLEGRRAGLDDGRHLGEVGVALPACDAEPAQRAAAKVLRDRRQVVEHGLGPAAEQVGHRRRRAAVGDVRHGRAREHLEQLARQVPDAAATGRAEADRSTATRTPPQPSRSTSESRQASKTRRAMTSGRSSGRLLPSPEGGGIGALIPPGRDAAAREDRRAAMAVTCRLQARMRCPRMAQPATRTQGAARPGHYSTTWWTACSPVARRVRPKRRCVHSRICWKDT